MEPSIFTQIITGLVPCHKIYEDAKTFAFLDIHPVQPGHVLVVPKKQVEFIWDLDLEDYQAVTLTALKVARHIREILNVPYVGERIVGVDVPHAHVQLIPFADTADLRVQPDMNAEPDHPALTEIAARLRMMDDV